jgi:pantothenate kinase
MTTHTDELFLTIGRLEGKIDALIQMQRVHEDAIKQHDERIRTLEHQRSYAMGVAGAVGALASLAAHLLVKALS